MQHKRSEESLQRREARKIVQRFAFQDQKLAETVNRLTPEQIVGQLQLVFPECVTYHFAAQYGQGEVLVDSRGRGSFQGQNVETKCWRCQCWFLKPVIYNPNNGFLCPHCGTKN